MHDIKAEHSKVNALEEEKARLRTKMQSICPSWEEVNNSGDLHVATLKGDASVQEHWDPWDPAKVQSHVTTPEGSASSSAQEHWSPLRRSVRESPKLRGGVGVGL